MAGRFEQFIRSRWTFIASLVVTAILCLGVFTTLNGETFMWFFSSDALYLPALYRDLFTEGGGLSGWHFNPSPNFFPDMPVYFLLMRLTGNLLVSTAIYALLQYTAIVLLFYFIIKMLSGTRTANLAATTGNLLLGLFLVHTIKRHSLYYSFYLLINAYHSSVLVMTLACLGVYLLFLRKGGGWKLVILFILVFLSVVSDRINLVAFSVPVFLLSLLYRKLPFSKRGVLASGLTVVAAAAAGMYFFSFLNTLDAIHFDLPYKMFAYDEMWSSASLILQYFAEVILRLNLVSLLIVLAALGLLYMTARSVVVLLRRGQAGPGDIYILLATLFGYAVLLVPVVNGNFNAIDCFRYNIYPVYLVILSLPLFIEAFLRRFAEMTTALITALFIISIITVWPVVSSSSLKAFAATYPDKVRQVDDAAKDLGLSYGVGTYWDAKVVWMFSRAGLKVYNVHPNLTKYYHVSNEHHYHAEDAVFSFAIGNDIDMKQVGEMFGEENIRTFPEAPGLVVLPEFRYVPDQWGPVILSPEPAGEAQISQEYSP